MNPDTKLSLGRAAALALVFLVAAGLRIAASSDDYFTSDTADYVRAGRAGLADLYTEARSITLLGFYRKWKDPEFRRHPAEALGRAEDNLALRHFHGPGSAYVLAAAHDLGLNEYQQRIVWGLIGALACSLLAAALYGLGAATWLGLAAGLLAAADARNIQVDVEPNPPHTLYLMLAMLLFTLAAAWWRSKRPWLLYACAAVLAAATLTFELAAGLMLGAMAALGWEARKRHTAREMLRPALRFLGAYLASLVVFWPGGFLRGASVLCAIGNVGILLRQQHSYANPAWLATAGSLLGSYALTAALAALFVAALVLKRPKSPAEKRLLPGGLWLALACYAILALLFGLSARFRNLPYCSQAFFPLVVFVTATVHRASEARRWVAMAAAAVMFLGAGTGTVSALNARREPDPLRQIVVDIQQIARPEDGAILVNDISLVNGLQLYLPRYQVEMTASGLEMRHPEAAPRVLAALLSTAQLDGATEQRARELFPPRFTYRANKATLWLGTGKMPASPGPY